METKVRNERVTFDYEIIDRWQAGLILLGLEVKSLKTGRGASLAGSFIELRAGEAYLIGATIAPYQPSNTPADYHEKRPRKLLLSQSELKDLARQASERGLTVVPLALYIKGGKWKLEIGLARGKKHRDKRETIKKRETQRMIERTLKN